MRKPRDTPGEPAAQSPEPAGEALPPALPPAAPVQVRRPTIKGLAWAAVALVAGIPLLIFACQVLGVADFSHPVDKAYLSAMRLDLRNLYAAQENYFTSHATYASSLESLGFTPAMKVTVTMGSATDSGWSATAAHSGTTKVCAIAVGTSVAAGQVDGEVTCPMRTTKEDGR